MKIVFLDTETVGEVKNLNKLSSLGDLKLYANTNNDQRIHRLSDADIVITNKVIIDKDVIDACKCIKLICVAATGVDHIDTDYARTKGITVKNVKDYSTDSVAQSTFAILFYLLNRTRYFDEYVKSGEYSKSLIFTHYGRTFWELKGKKFGIIGLGKIGERVASIAKSFGAEVIYFSTSGKNTKNKKYAHFQLIPLLQASDIVSIHCPLNNSTQNLINFERISQMKPSAYILNMGRGGIVNEYDLALALDKGIIAGAGLDVLEHEPINPENPLLKIKNNEKICITPHIAWISNESRELLIEKIYLNIKEYVKQKILSL